MCDNNFCSPFLVIFGRRWLVKTVVGFKSLWRVKVSTIYG